MDEKISGLYQIYCTGDSAQARQALEGIAAIAENGGERPVVKAWTMFLCYARLYVLDARVGNEPTATLDFVKARYWYLRRAELGGYDVKAATEALSKVTPERCVEMVDGYDKDPTNWKGPRYLAEIRGKSAP
jgi:hypothetical protein